MCHRDLEVSGYLVGSPAFKAGGTGDPRPAGSIPVHLRERNGTGPGQLQKPSEAPQLLFEGRRS
jgi:hypothetical protein